MDEKKFFEKIKKIGGRAYIVGGWVRDLVMGLDSHDKDYMVAGADKKNFLNAFQGAKKIGNSFPVFLLEIDGKKSEIAFARREKKAGAGYKGFSVDASPDVTLEEDLFRRDTTINSMAFDLETGKIIDPYGGREDIAKKIVRATSAHFSEDPVRALRAARQAAQFGFTIEPETVEQMRKCAAELSTEPKDRIFMELEKALAVKKPSLFFRNLQKANLLKIIFPHLHDLIGKTQPVCWHPEGDAFEHTMLALDRAADLTPRLEVRFAALMHDIGKGVTEEKNLPHHYGHEKAGLAILKEIDANFPLPKRWRQCAEIAIAEHMRAPRLTHAGKIVALLVKISKHPIGFDGFGAVLRADSGGWLPEYLLRYDIYIEAIMRAHSERIPEDLTGPAIATWLRQKEIEAFLKIYSDRTEA